MLPTSPYHQRVANSVPVLRAGTLRFPYAEAGSQENPVVLFLHGFPDHEATFRHQLPYFAARGYRAISPTMRGYALSCQASDRRDYHVNQLAEDVVSWLDDLGVQKVHLVGHDWGAVVGYVLANLAPERLCSLSTIAVPHPFGLLKTLRRYPGQLRNSWYMFFFQWRGLSDHVVSRGDFEFIERLWRAWSPTWELPEAVIAGVKETFRKPGVVNAALAYYRCALSGSLSAHGRRTQQLLRGRIKTPTLAITGIEDGCMDTRLFDEAMSSTYFDSQIQVARIPGAGHFVHQEQPLLVNRLIQAWCDEHSR